MASKRGNHTIPVYPNSLRSKYVNMTYVGFHKSLDKILSKSLFKKKKKNLSDHKIENIYQRWVVS